jgi:ABC-2 type transport system permease protein
MVSTTPSIPAPQTLYRGGLASELGALLAVIRKQWLLFVRYPSWVVAFIIWPVIFPAAYILTARALAGPDGSGVTAFRQAAGTADYLGFIAIGTTIWMWQNVVLWNVGTGLREEQLRGTLESNWLAPAKRFYYLLGNSLTHLAISLAFLLVSFAEFALVFGVRYQGSLWLGALILVAAIPSVYGLGMAFASLVITAKEANAFVFLVRGLVMVFCGITFPVGLLPGWMQQAAAWLPQTYVIRGARLAVLESAGFAAIRTDLVALLLFGLFWLAAGYLLFVWMERRARQTGAIGQY